jgi:chromosome segregation ATPase
MKRFFLTLAYIISFVDTSVASGPSQEELFDGPGQPIGPMTTPAMQTQRPDTASPADLILTLEHDLSRARLGEERAQQELINKSEELRIAYADMRNLRSQFRKRQEYIDEQKKILARADNERNQLKAEIRQLHKEAEVLRDDYDELAQQNKSLGKQLVTAREAVLAQDTPLLAQIASLQQQCRDLYEEAKQAVAAKEYTQGLYRVAIHNLSAPSQQAVIDQLKEQLATCQRERDDAIAQRDAFWANPYQIPGKAPFEATMPDGSTGHVEVTLDELRQYFQAGITLQDAIKALSVNEVGEEG